MDQQHVRQDSWQRSWHTRVVGIDKVVSQFRSSNRNDVDEVVTAMDELAGDAPGWMHIQPWLDDHDVPKETIAKRLFRSTGPEVPNATWVPDASSGTGSDQIGFSHGAGSAARQLLTESGVHAPEGWNVTSDHRHRGLVLVGPPGQHDAVLAFMLAASAVLSRVPTDDRWIYGVSRRS